MAQKYLFIAISFYPNIAILCVKMSRVNKALKLLINGKSLTLRRLIIIIAINPFIIIVNFHNHFVKALTEIFQFWRAIPESLS